jgi:hypothetical protein
LGRAEGAVGGEGNGDYRRRGRGLEKLRWKSLKM